MTRKLIANVYENLEKYLCAMLMSLMVFCLGAQVFFRYVLNASLTWSEELSRFAFVWVVYMGAILGAKERIHIRVTATQLLLPIRYRQYLVLFADAFWIAVNLLFAYQGVMQVRHLLRFSYISPAMQWNMAYIYAIVPLGFVLMSLRILQGYWRDYRRGGFAEMGRELLIHEQTPVAEDRP